MMIWYFGFSHEHVLVGEKKNQGSNQLTKVYLEMAVKMVYAK